MGQNLSMYNTRSEKTQPETEHQQPSSSGRRESIKTKEKKRTNQFDKITSNEASEVLRRIKARDEEVNIVFSGAAGIGVDQYCEDFSTLTGFRFVKNGERYSSNLNQVENIRTKSASEISKPERALTFHMMDMIKQGYLHLEEALNNSETPESKTRFRVFHQSILDHVNVMAEASKKLSYTNDTEMCLIQNLGALLWKLSNGNCCPNNTLYVYIKYSDQTHKHAYGCFLENVAKQIEDAGNPSELQTLESTTRSMTPLIEQSKKEMDLFYSANVMIEDYFSIVIDCADRFLLNPRYAITICHKILSVVDQLQKIGVWGANHAERLKFLAQRDWKINRIYHIPVALAIKNTSKGELQKDIDQFAKKNPTFPVPEQAIPNFGSSNNSTPSVSPRRYNNASASPLPSSLSTCNSDLSENSIDSVQDVNSAAAAATTTTAAFYQEIPKCTTPRNKRIEIVAREGESGFIGPSSNNKRGDYGTMPRLVSKQQHHHIRRCSVDFNSFPITKEK